MFDFVDKNGRRIRVRADVVVSRDPRGKPVPLAAMHAERSADPELKALLAKVPDSEFLSRP